MLFDMHMFYNIVLSEKNMVENSITLLFYYKYNYTHMCIDTYACIKKQKTKSMYTKVLVVISRCWYVFL